MATLTMLLAAAYLGAIVRGSVLGLLIDARGRFSLSHLQMVLWTFVVIPLIAGVTAGRLLAGVADALSFSIPPSLLAVMGISIASTAGAIVVKSTKDMQAPERIAASDASDRPHFSQVFLVEEGELADRTIDITKFQNFWFTLILVTAYVSLAASHIKKLGAAMTALPEFNETLVVLLLISHAGYLASKLPARQGKPEGLTLASKLAGAKAVLSLGLPDAPPATYVPRNPGNRQ
ncbi:hypothetical protein HZ993_14360 [Rhodoferax sp. AJA081-3]|uniref:hypothetical protein n=1 Tax=Rhodoferax sp. AJA081-3 TaxID=2752316 RepID=UPI001AE03CFD|nr:hypothetical protein [Rhodoferax sp. AJA081-3]QTN26507.1 hypothetical protein HZ993_14360 [Rhodoferax sp. AJA081-3]